MSLYMHGLYISTIPATPATLTLGMQRCIPCTPRAKRRRAVYRYGRGCGNAGPAGTHAVMQRIHQSLTAMTHETRTLRPSRFTLCAGLASLIHQELKRAHSIPLGASAALYLFTGPLRSRTASAGHCTPNLLFGQEMYFCKIL